VDINSGFGRGRADWIHANSVTFDAAHDVLLLGGAYTSEVYVIDHAAPSETPLVATSTAGGGTAAGSLLYRFGSSRFGEQHDVRVVACDTICFTVFNNGRYRDATTCAFASDGALQTDCGSEVLLVTLPSKALLLSPPEQGLEQVAVDTLFDAGTVTSLLGEDDGGDFLRLCTAHGASCVRQRRFFSLILASAQLVGMVRTAGSYLAITVGVAGTYFEVAFDPTTAAYSDVRFVHQNFGVVASQQPPELLGECALPSLVGLSRTPNSGWSTSVFHAMRYAESYLQRCQPEAPPPPAPGSACPSLATQTCQLSSDQVLGRCACAFHWGTDCPVGVQLTCL